MKHHPPQIHRHSKQQQGIEQALTEFIDARLLRGDEAYMVTLMFKALRGNEVSKARQMNKVAEIVYSRILTRLVKHPRKTSPIQMPLWLSCADWPVQKIEGLTISDNLANDGRHLHAMVFVPQNARTGERLSQIIEANPAQFLVGRALTRLHAMPIEKTVAKATGYALKSVHRGRTEWGDVLILPKTGGEMGHRPLAENRIIRFDDEFVASVKAWCETHRS